MINDYINVLEQYSICTKTRWTKKKQLRLWDKETIKTAFEDKILITIETIKTLSKGILLQTVS